MDAILRFVARFAREYGGAGAPPPPADFFWDDPEYHALLEALKAASASVERVEHIPNERIQRGGTRGGTLSGNLKATVRPASAESSWPGGW